MHVACVNYRPPVLVRKSVTKPLKEPSHTTYIPHLYKGYVKTHKMKCTQNGGVPSHWSSDVLCVTGSDWCPTDIVPSISSPQGSQHQCALVAWSSPWRITTTEGSSPWCSPCTVHHHCTVHWWVQLDIAGQGDIVSNGYHLTGYSSDGCSRRGDCSGHLG